MADVAAPQMLAAEQAVVDEGMLEAGSGDHNHSDLEGGLASVKINCEGGHPTHNNSSKSDNLDFGEKDLYTEDGETRSSKLCCSSSSDSEATTTATPSKSSSAGVFGGKGLIVLAGFVNNFGTFGPTTMFGLFVPAFKEAFDIPLGTAASLVSGLQALQFFGGLLAGFFIPHRISHRGMAVLTAVWAILGYIGSALAQDSMQMRLLLALGVGWSLGMNNLCGITALQAQVPVEKRGFSIGIATCGATLGTMMLPSVTSWLMATVGWRMALGIMGVATSITLLIASPAFKVSPDRLPPKRAVGAPRRSLRERIPFTDLAFVIWWLNMLLCFIGFFAPLTLMAQYVKEELHLTPQVAATTYMIVGGCGAPGRAGQGWLAQKTGGNMRMYIIAQFLTGIVTMGMPLCSSAPMMYVWAIFYGASTGPLIALATVVVSDLFGMERLVLLSGLSRFAVGIGVLVGPSFIALIVTSAGYLAAFVVAGCFIWGSSLLLLIIPVIQRMQASKRAEDLRRKEEALATGESMKAEGVHTASV
mmetsp:Transcript_52685/g.112415  ORF Transcript_52685/g.112415 Transcript_52685/m.112415 type:complete len:531 (+) Transcript_52685:121-1713(+)|eukprot:CAMPEP_0206467970 /NCGR_PEP_ID=MMETSP0324_2-20121206/29345_1 /ASSEMBLY_ACC=CAM_ASM_000836 /TAXON_ID=2866 /ORGANISM="Crypthecodinium cohnii, Strain Seligo" /LENGTH=530 /DNA_ID=CAMNT_0053941327 /DNA_START=35 /DNA_END=1627 /DNA_ORIENTATION=-